MRLSAPRAADRLATVSSIAAVLVASIAATVLIGWIADAPALKSPLGPITMKTNAALGLLLNAAGLWAYLHGARRSSAAAAMVAALLGAVTLSEHLFGWDAGIDQALFTEARGAAATASPNRMGPNGALSVFLAGIAILLLLRRNPRDTRRAQVLSIIGGVLATLALAGYMYRASELYAIARYTGIALHTALAVLILHVGILTARAHDGPMAVFVATGVAGTILRRLALPVVLVPLLLGYILLTGLEAGLYERDFAIALFAVSVIVILGAVVWKTAVRIAAAEAERQRAELERDELLVRERLARDDAERANRLKDQFIAILSHELRTPLNVMLGWTHVLESETSPERHARAAGIVARNGRILTRLVEDLLDVSRVSAGQMEIDRQVVEFSLIVRAAYDAFLPLAKDNGISLDVQLDAEIGEVEGDRDRLRQIVSNLLSNAIKFTPEGGYVRVTTASSDGAMALAVTDSGIGFDQQFASQLFEPFRQADSSYKREYGGLGLGLSIARHIAVLHGGTLTGTSPGPGEGATFTLRLPVLRRAHGQHEPHDARRSIPVTPTVTPTGSAA